MATGNPLEGYCCRRCGNDDIQDDWVRLDIIIDAGPRPAGNWHYTPEMVTDFYVCPACMGTEWAAGIVAMTNVEYRVNLWSTRCIVMCKNPGIARRITLTGRYPCPGCGGRAELEDATMTAARRRFRDIMRGVP
jgi:RNA polymerase subunit RPABC4/transcription elongation factor Spt4